MDDFINNLAYELFSVLFAVLFVLILYLVIKRKHLREEDQSRDN